MKMKKALALLAALCMLLTALPVLAEEDASGTWHIVMLGMTVGTLDLNADGTCSLITSDEGEEAPVEGTWTQDGEKITVDANGNTLPLTYDGTNLLFDLEGLAALGVDTSSLGEGMDPSMLSSLIQISREPGKITAAEFSAYQADGTLPEGKTEEDMQAIQAEMMSFFLSMMGNMDLGSGASAEAPAPELTVVEENFYVREGYGSQEGYYIAKVQNNTEEPAYLSQGTLTLTDAEGNEIGKAEYLSTSGSSYLEPGETTFVSLTADFPEGAEVAGYTAELQPSAISYQTPDTAVEVSSAELRMEEGYFTNYLAAATVTNTTDGPMSRLTAIMALRASDGKLVGLTTSGLYYNELAAGSTITLIDSLDSRVVDYCDANGLTLGQVEAYAWIDTY